MSKRSAARHRATANPLEAISRAVSSNAGTVGRQAAVVAAASGLVLTIGMPAQGAAPAVRESTSIPAPGLDIERASLATVTVAAAKDVKVELDRAPVTSKPAPEPEPEPAPAPQPERETETVRESAQSRITTASRSTAQPAGESTQTRQSAPERQSGQSSAHEAKPKPKPKKQAPQRSSVGGVVGAAYGGIGVPYVFGGKTASGWDCSGFVSWAYRQAGISIPSSTSAILGSGQFVRTSNPKPGDLVFQRGGSHVGIYVGNGQMIGAQNPSVGTFQHSVTRNPLYGYYTYVG